MDPGVRYRKIKAAFKEDPKKALELAYELHQHPFGLFLYEITSDIKGVTYGGYRYVKQQELTDRRYEVLEHDGANGLAIHYIDVWHVPYGARKRKYISRDLPMIKVYLAGPDVFLANAKDVLAKKKELLEYTGFEVITPLDNESDDAHEIANFNYAAVQHCDVILANVEPFRGTEPDSGTVFEIGMAHGLGKQIVTYVRGDFLELPSQSYSERVKQFLDQTSGAFAFNYEGKEWNIESFGLKQNLMLSCASVEFENFSDAVHYLVQTYKK